MFHSFLELLICVSSFRGDGKKPQSLYCCIMVAVNGSEAFSLSVLYRMTARRRAAAVTTTTTISLESPSAAESNESTSSSVGDSPSTSTIAMVDDPISSLRLWLPHSSRGQCCQRGTSCSTTIENPPWDCRRPVPTR